MAEVRDIVSFSDILRSYPPGAEMEVRYEIEPNSELKTSQRDWVGLFRVGWTSSRDYYTFEWAPQPTDAEAPGGVVKFAGRRLPPEDGHFYQLCYVSRDGTVRGASAPFQFAPVSVCIDDLELVEVTDESLNGMMVLQKKKEMDSLRRQSEEALTEMGVLQQALAQAQAENDRLERDGEAVRKELEAAQEASTKEAETLQCAVEGARGEAEGVKEELRVTRGELATTREAVDAARAQIIVLQKVMTDKDARISDLEQQLRVLGENLEQEKGQAQELNQAQTSAIRHVEQLEKRLSEAEGEVVVLTSDNGELQKQLREKHNQIDGLEQLLGPCQKELEKTRVHLEAREQENAELNAVCLELREEGERWRNEIAALQQQLTEQGSLRMNVDAVLTEKESRIEKLEQDLCIAQTNITELMGAQGTAFEAPQQAPPQALAPTPGEPVDKAAYVALQGAYETVVKYLKEEQQQREKFVQQNRVAQAECDDLVERVKECKKLYEARAMECIQLRRQMKRSGVATETGGQQQAVADQELDIMEKLREMEEAQEQMMKDCQEAASELSIRGQECKSQQERIQELEGELAALHRRYEEMEDRADEKTAEKNENIQKLNLILEEKTEELAMALNRTEELNAQVSHMRSQAQVAQAAAQSRAANTRACPVCNVSFPSRMDQKDFEKHVQGHFK